MDAENKKTWRVAHHRRNTKAYKFAKQAVEHPGTKVHTTIDPGRYQRCHLENTAGILKGSGIIFEAGNDAPKGGRHGDYVIVTL